MVSPESHQLPLLVLVRDLLFASKIRSTAESIGVPLTMIRDASALQSTEGSRLVVDLNQPGVLEAAAAWGKRTGNPVIGFVSHVDTDTIRAAREAGIQQVLARSRFVEILPDVLR